MTVSVEEFKAFVAKVEGGAGYQQPAAFGLGIATLGIENPQDVSAGAIAPSETAKVLDTYYPCVNVNENFGSAAVFAAVTGYASGTKSYRLTAEQINKALEHFAPFVNDGKDHPNIRALEAAAAILAQPSRFPRVAVVSFIGALDDSPQDVHDAYLRLHALSYCKVQPHGISLDGAFGVLNNVVWTNHGPFDPDTFEATRLQLRALGESVQVHSIDKFPRLVDYVMPVGVRLADADRARLGAHLAPGTTIMHEGFVNFNAGTLGTSMVEGRISAGVVIGDGSDVGGGASIMGTLSGGGKSVISVGEGSLLGANSGLGISLGDRCTLEAGLYVTAGSKVKCLWDGEIRKASELSGHNGLLFRRHSQTGAIEVLAKENEVVLNEALHSND